MVNGGGIKCNLVPHEKPIERINGYTRWIEIVVLHNFCAFLQLEQVLQLDPKNSGAFYQLSRAYQRLGNAAKAQEMARQASALTKSQHEEATKAQDLRFGVPTHE